VLLFGSYSGVVRINKEKNVLLDASDNGSNTAHGDSFTATHIWWNFTSSSSSSSSYLDMLSALKGDKKNSGKCIEEFHSGASGF
jgi:hypothetical protein